MTQAKKGGSPAHAASVEPCNRCWVEVDFAAVRHNVAAIREHVGPGFGVMAVVKTNAYGHGMEDLAKELRYLVEMFGVANVTEALHLRRVAPDSPILILGPALPEEREAIVQNEFIPVVSSVAEAKEYAALLDKNEDGSPAAFLQVHLKVDTGMGRIGVWWEDAVEAANTIDDIPGIRLWGVATHLPSAEEDADFTTEQLTCWERLVAEIRIAGLELPVVHALNSAGAIRYAGRQGQPNEPGSRTGDMVRAGLMLYGCSPIPEFQPRLRPVLTWKSRIVLIRDVPAGRSVSYGRTYVTPGPMRIATVAVGYGDGYQRHLSNTGAEVLVAGRRCAVLGRVTMDQIMVDITGLDQAQIGSEVVLIGRQGDQGIPVTELAAKAGTIPYEIFTAISSRVTRRFLTE